MTDQELSSLGERLYAAIIAAQLSEPALEDLANAISTRRPWTNLGERTKIAVFVVAAQMTDKDGTTGAADMEEEVVGPPPPVDVADEEASRARQTASDLSVGVAIDSPLVGHDAFDDAAEADPAVDACNSIHQEAQVADTSTSPRAAEHLPSKDSKETADDEGDDASDEDLENAPSEVVAKSRENSSS